MPEVRERHKVVIDKFHELLRSGKDYSVEHMYKEAGKTVYIKQAAVVKIITRYYRTVINREMIDFIDNLTCCRSEEIEKFSDKFDVCWRESILLIRYIRKRKK